MWIKRKESDSVNLDFVRYIQKIIIENTEYGSSYRIEFRYNHKSTDYYFETKKECEDYYDALMNFIGAQEIPVLNNILNL